MQLLLLNIFVDSKFEVGRIKYRKKTSEKETVLKFDKAEVQIEESILLSPLFVDLLLDLFDPPCLE